MNTYELMVLYKPDYNETEVKKLLKDLSSKIGEFKGTNVEEDYWGLKNLAYTIDKFTKAYYAVYKFEMESSQVNNLVLWLNRQDEQVLRNMITRIN